MESIFTQGNQKLLDGEATSALVDYMKCESAFEDGRDFYFANRALAYLKIKDYTRCVADCRRALKIVEHEPSYYRMGAAYFELEE